MFAAMPSEKRQRQDEGRLLRLEEQRVATQKVQRKRQFRTLAIILGGGPGRGGLRHLQRRRRRRGHGRRRHHDDHRGSRRRAGVEVVLPGAGASITGETPCPPPTAPPSARRASSRRRPCASTRPRPTRPRSSTTKGDIVIELDTANAPDHREQLRGPRPLPLLRRRAVPPDRPGLRRTRCGDPVGPSRAPADPGTRSRTSRPPTRPPPTRRARVAMAKTAEPDSGGSQFFFVIGDAGGRPAGQRHLHACSARSSRARTCPRRSTRSATPRRQPTEIVAITSVTITES